MWNAPMTPLEAPSLTDQVYRRLLEAIDPSITGRVLAAAPYKAEHAQDRTPLVRASQSRCG